MDQLSFTIGVAATLGNGKIVAIRVHDNARDVWYSWNDGVWDASPQIVPGAGNLYIAFWSINVGETAATFTATIKQDGVQIASKSESCGPAVSFGLEVTVDMPATGTTITLDVTP